MKKLISIISAICIVVGMIPFSAYAANITPEISLDEFSERLQELQTEYDNGNMFSEITIENGSEFYYADGDKKPVVNSQNEKAETTITNNDIEIPLSAIEPYCELPETSTYSLDNEGYKDITVNKETVETLGFEVDIEDDKAVLTQPYQTERLIVKSKYDINPLDSVAIVEGYNDLHIVQFDNQESAKQAEEYYNNQKLIEYAEPDLVMSTMEIDYHETASTYSNSAITYDNHLSWGSESIGIDDYIDYLGDVSTLPEIVVGIIDTGIDLDHEFLKNRIIKTNYNTSGSGEKDSEDDDKGHGTHVAGIVADNTTDNVKIKSYKSLDCNGSGEIIDTCLAIYKAMEDNVNIINMSLGAKGTSATMETAVNNAVESGIIVCVAAGNNGADASKYIPASIDSCITVGAIDAFDSEPYWSNWGELVDIVAPGVSINSTFNDGGYAEMSGTSMACPFAAAASALLLCKNSEYKSSDINSIFNENGREWTTNTDAGNYGIPALYIGNIVDFSQRERTSTPKLSLASGRYSDSITVEITCTDKDAEIYYTLNGNRATQETGTLYKEPITIDKVTTVHAVAYSPNKMKSLQTVSEYYITFTDPDENFVIDSEGVIVEYLGANNYLTIPNKIAGVTVTAIGSDVFSGSSIIMIKFPDSLSSIYDNAFYNCSKLYSVDAKNLKSVGYYAFGECVSLTEIDMSQLEFVDDWGFAGCISLTSIYNNKLTKINDYSFHGLDSVINIDLPKVTEIGSNGLSDMGEIKSLNLPNLEVLGPYGLSALCALEEIDLPKLRVLETKSGNDGSNFCLCFSAKTINIPSYKGELPNGVFDGTSSLKEFNHNGITKVGESAFFGSSVKSVVLNNATYIAKDAFNRCRNLESIYIPSVTEIGYQAFREANNVEILFAPSLASTQSLPVVNPNTKIYLSSKFIEYNETSFKEQNATIIAPKGSYAETVAVNGVGTYDNNFKFVPSDYRYTANDKIDNTEDINVRAHGRSIRVTNTGLRFGFSWDAIPEIEDLSSNVEYGFVYHYNYNNEPFGSDKLTIDNVGTDNIKMKKAVNLDDTNEGKTVFNLVFTNIPDSNQGTNISVRAYVCIDGMYFYSNSLNGSFAEVSSKVLQDDAIDESTKTMVKQLLKSEV